MAVLKLVEPVEAVLDDIEEELQDVVDRQETLLARLDVLDESSKEG